MVLNGFREDRWYASVGLTETYDVKGIEGLIWVYENEIDSSSQSDFVACALTLLRPTVDFYESYEVGYYQDHSGYWFYTGKIVNGFWSQRRHGWVIPESRAYSLKLLEVDGRFEAYIDGELVDYMYFSDAVTEERIYASQCESTEPSNPMRGHFWNLKYYNSTSWHSWTDIYVYQDRPYYARITSTDEYHSTIQGDLNLDYKVDSQDVAWLNAYWCDPCLSDQTYYPFVDINHNGYSDIFDCALINCHWHKSW